MAAAGDILVRTLQLLEGNIRPGVTTADLDRAAEKFIRSQGAEPAFKGYRGFPGSICTSPNSMVVHGIPGRYKLERGDIISLDVGVVLDGWVADAARTFPVGTVTPVARKLLTVTEGSPGRGPLLEEGMVLAIEPMTTAGRHAVRMGEDHWAIYSQDGSLTAHFEFTVAVTAEGPRILTPWHEAGRKAAAASAA
jgi:methionyl aminopeptidase